jgi:microcystin-dependent protein
MSDVFLGQIMLAGFNFAPRGFAFCNGQLLSIAQNTALFSLLGTTYGGDGQTTFALPDLRSRVPIHFGQGAGLPSYAEGQVGGAEAVTLQTSQMPSHGHVHFGSTNGATTPGQMIRASQLPAATHAMSGAAVLPTGSSLPHGNLQPYATVNYVIAIEGIFPSRN